MSTASPTNGSQPNGTTTTKPATVKLDATDDELLQSIRSGKLRLASLEQHTNNDHTRAVSVRRQYIASELHAPNALSDLPYQDVIDYTRVHGQCCENVIGAVPIPVGLAGPLRIDDVEYFVPLATTEGALVASTGRGAKAITSSGGATTVQVRDGMSRAPVIQTPNIKRAAEIGEWIASNMESIKSVFNGTSRFAKLQSAVCTQAGRLLYIRFVSTSGDAMGMNMIGKGSEAVMMHLLDKFPDIDVLSLSGNLCTDKKPSAMNWVAGRGKSVVAEVRIPYSVVKSVLKSTPQRMVDVNNAKNLVGSALAGSIGGFNAHAANIVAAIYIATGQDPAQVVEGSNCMTLMEAMPSSNADEPDLYMTVTMPCIEVGTLGGGTTLQAQRAMLNLLVAAGKKTEAAPEFTSSTLARIVASTVLAGELSLMAAHAEGHLIKSHLALNRKPQQ